MSQFVSLWIHCPVIAFHISPLQDHNETKMIDLPAFEVVLWYCKGCLARECLGRRAKKKKKKRKKRRKKEKKGGAQKKINEKTKTGKKEKKEARKRIQRWFQSWH